MVLNENMNEEQDMPVPQEPVQQQEEATLPQPLSEEEEKSIRTGEVPEFPEEVPTELIEEVAKGVEDALEPQVQEPEPQVQEPEPQVQEPRMGPETSFDIDRQSLRYVLPSKEELEVDYDFSDPKGSVSMLFNKGYIANLVNSQGKVVGINDLVRQLMSQDRLIAEENGLDFSYRDAYLGTMSKIYIDAMKRIGKDVSKINPDSPRFQKYTASVEGAREIDEALTIILLGEQYSGELPPQVKRKVRVPQGRGRLDSRYSGLTDRDYENMSTLGKIGYNIAVAGKSMAETVFPGFEAVAGEDVPGVAPVGEMIGVMAGFMVPFSAANKLMKTKNILQAEKYGRIPGWAVRNAVAGAAADTYVFAESEGTLANMFAESDSVLINNAFTTALAVDVDDPYFEAKAKVALEGVVLGGVIDATVTGLKNVLKSDKSGAIYPQGRRLKFGSSEAEPIPSGFNPELDKAILDLEVKEEELGSSLKEIEDEIFEARREGDEVSLETLELEASNVKQDVQRTRTVREVLEGREDIKPDGGQEEVEAFIESTRDKLDRAKGFDEPKKLTEEEKSLLSKEELAEVKRQEREEKASFASLKKVLDKYPNLLPDIVNPKTSLIDWKKLSASITSLKNSDTTLKEAVKIEDDLEFAFRDVMHKYNLMLNAGEPLRLEQEDVVDLLQISALLYKQDPTVQNQVKLTLVYDILEEIRLPEGSRVKGLVPAEKETSLKILNAISEKSDVELKEILANRARSNKVSTDGALKYVSQINEHGIDAASKPFVRRFFKGLADIAVDIRTNNILTSLGLPTLAISGGALVKVFRGVEYRAGRGIQKLGFKNLLDKQKLIKSNKNKIKELEAQLTEEPDEAVVLKIKDLNIQVAQLDRTPQRVEDEIAILKELETLEQKKIDFDWGDADEEALVKMRTQAEEIGLVVEDPTIRKEAKGHWERVKAYREEREAFIEREIQEAKDKGVRIVPEDLASDPKVLELDENIAEELVLARSKSALVPSENPTRISDLEGELKALKDPTHRRTKTGEYIIDNVLYTLSGGKVRTAGRELEPGDILEVIKGLLSASAPSRIDPSISTKSESLLGAGLKSGYDEMLGVDPAGLGRLGKLAQGIQDPVARNLVTALVSILEFIPRKGLGTIDEMLKTRDFIREFMIRIDENIKSLTSTSTELGFKTKDQEEIVEIIKEAMVGSLGLKNDAIDFTEAIMEELRKRTLLGDDLGSQALQGSRKKVLSDAKLEQDVLVLDQMSKLDLPDNVKGQIDELLEGVEAFTKGRRIKEEQLGSLQKIVARTVEEAQQFARETTVTQDVPPMLEGLIKGLQRYSLGRAVSPFSRSITNIAAMTTARTPFLNLIIRKERQALKGALGEIEQARSIGKVATGIGLIGIGYALTDPDKKYHLEVVDKGSWKEYNLVIPRSGAQFEEELKAGALRWYQNNTEIIHRELEREGLELTQANAIDYITSNLPEWEDRAGSVKVDFSRFGPFNTLIEMGMMFRDGVEKTPWEYMTEKEEENSPIMDIVTQTFDFVSNQGYLSPANDFFKMFDNPEYAAKAFINGWGADLINPGRGLLSTAGEPGQLDFRPSREEDMWTQKRFNQILAEDPNNLMKKRDFLGRVIDAPDRFIHLLGKTQDLDLINAEMEEMGLRKRVPKPTSVTKFSGIDLRKYKLKSNLIKEEKELIDVLLPAKDGQNAYEDFVIMAGSINVKDNPYSEIKGSAINGLQEYFKSEEYKVLKDTILKLDKNHTPDEKYEAEAAYELIRKRVNKWVSMGRDKAALALWDMADMYIDEGGNSLRDIYVATSEGEAQAEAQVNQRLQGLDALRKGGNK